VENEAHKIGEADCSKGSVKHSEMSGFVIFNLELVNG